MRVYGPVPSRRFGLSLGIDVFARKTCQYDCIYCQLGPTDCTVIEPVRDYSVEEILDDVRTALEDSPLPDVITLAGSGDPTLYADLEPLMIGLKKLCPVPLLLITNGAMLSHERVAAAAFLADILAPSLDAGDPETFARVNRPHENIRFEDMVSGLVRVTHAHRGEVRLEVMLIAGVNDSEQQIRKIAAIASTLRFDRIDLNTPVRPPVPERGALPCDERVLDLARSIFGDRAFPIGRFLPVDERRPAPTRPFSDLDKDIRETLMRRPCTRDDIRDSFGLDDAEVGAALDRLNAAGLLHSSVHDDGVYYRSTGEYPDGFKDRHLS